MRRAIVRRARGAQSQARRARGRRVRRRGRGGRGGFRRRETGDFVVLRRVRRARERHGVVPLRARGVERAALAVRRGRADAPLESACARRASSASSARTPARGRARSARLHPGVEGRRRTRRGRREGGTTASVARASAGGGDGGGATPRVDVVAANALARGRCRALQGAGIVGQPSCSPRLTAEIRVDRRGRRHRAGHARLQEAGARPQPGRPVRGEAAGRARRARLRMRRRRRGSAPMRTYPAGRGDRGRRRRPRTRRRRYAGCSSARRRVRAARGRPPGSAASDGLWNAPGDAEVASGAREAESAAEASGSRRRLCARSWQHTSKRARRYHHRRRETDPAQVRGPPRDCAAPSVRREKVEQAAREGTGPGPPRAMAAARRRRSALRGASMRWSRRGAERSPAMGGDARGPGRAETEQEVRRCGGRHRHGAGWTHASSNAAFAEKVRRERRRRPR